MMKKSEVETRRHGRYADCVTPSINVKMHRFKTVDSFDVMERFNCTEKIADEACRFAVESASDEFWRDVPEIAGDIFGDGVKVWADGKSGGWLVVDGLEGVESWDCIALAKWRKFERLTLETARGLLDPSAAMDEIDANRWAENGAEQYNFIDGAGGAVVCSVDLKRAMEARRGEYMRVQGCAGLTDGAGI